MSRCSAPGKMILFGEHAVVFGKPALALAIDMRIACSVTQSDQYCVNGHPMKKKHHAYISTALDQAWQGPPIMIETSSGIPSGSGLGSSAAVTVACISALLLEKGRLDPETVARKAFEVEHAVQGRASPTDTSTSTHGHGVLVSPERGEDFLWRIEKGGKVWNMHHCEVSQLTFVVGYTGVHASTGPLVAKVKDYVEGSDDGRRAIDRIGEIVLDGLDAMRRGDQSRMGALMDENHVLLNSLGVGHPSLDRLVEVARKSSYGAKLTGAGGGGSMIALTDDPSGTSAGILAAGGKAFTVRVGCEGVRSEQ